MSRTHRRSAAALVYDSQSGEAAPRVVAKGYGLVADMIVQRAKEAGVEIAKNGGIAVDEEFQRVSDDVNDDDIQEFTRTRDVGVFDIALDSRIDALRERFELVQGVV